MKLVVTGGGSGGHVYPALAIADKFKKEIPDIDILYIGVFNRVEADVVSKTGYNLKLIHARGIEKKKVKDVLKTIKYNILGIKESRKILKEFKPDLVIGTGGNVCFPVCFNCGLLKIPYYLHEQNAFPGYANKMLQRKAKKIFLGFSEGAKYFKDQSKLIYSGNPVRSEFFDVNYEDARKKLGIDKDTFMVLIFGGSLGSKSLNDVAIEILEKYNGKKDVKFVFVTGKKYYDKVSDELKNREIKVESNVEILSYLYDMVTYLKASDIVIERSGALSTAEALAAGKVSIFIPSPYVSKNHQYFNAKSIVDKNAALMILEKDLTPDLLYSKIEYLRNNKDVCLDMSKKAFENSKKDTTDIIFNNIMK